MNWFRVPKKISRRYQSQIKKSRLVVLGFLSLSFIFIVHQLFFVVKKVSCHTSTDLPCSPAVTTLLKQQQGKSLFLINKKEITRALQQISPSEEVQITLGLPGKLALRITPAQSLAVSVFLSYQQPTLSDDASPIYQIDRFISSASAENYHLLPNGKLIPGKESGNINLLFSQKPSQDKLEQAFWLINEINKKTPITTGYLLGDNFYYNSINLPDIIIPITFSEAKLSRSLQSIPSLAKIKEHVKTIDLRFKHPIIR